MNLFHKELVGVLNESSQAKSLLGVPYHNLPIVGVSDSSVHFLFPNGKVRGVFFTKRKWGESRVTNLLIKTAMEGVYKQAYISLDRKLGSAAMRYYYDWAALNCLAPSIGKSKDPSRLCFANLSAEPQSGSGGGNVTCDGGLYRTVGLEEDWTTIRASAGTSQTVTQGDREFAGFMAGDNESRWVELVRSIFTFDISSIAGAVNSGSAFFTSTGGVANFGASIVLVGSSPAANNTLATSDYGNLGSTAFSDTVVSSGLWSPGEFEFELNATGLAAITGSVARLGLRTDFDISGTPPPWQNSGDSEYFGGYFADFGSNEPRLEIDYTPSSLPGNLLLLKTF